MEKKGRESEKGWRRWDREQREPGPRMLLARHRQQWEKWRTLSQCLSVPEKTITMAISLSAVNPFLADRTAAQYDRQICNRNQFDTLPVVYERPALYCSRRNRLLASYCRLSVCP